MLGSVSDLIEGHTCKDSITSHNIYTISSLPSAEMSAIFWQKKGQKVEKNL